MWLKLKTYFISLSNSLYGKVFLILVSISVLSLSSLNIYIDSKLPNEQAIRDIELQIPLKIFSSDGKLIGEFGEKRRTALNFDEIPSHYINDVMAA